MYARASAKISDQVTIETLEATSSHFASRRELPEKRSLRSQSDRFCRIRPSMDSAVTRSQVSSTPTGPGGRGCERASLLVSLTGSESRVIDTIAGGPSHGCKRPELGIGLSWRRPQPKHRGNPAVQISKAVITAAGRGARQFPASDPVQKAMLPLVDRDGLTKPVLQIIAEEAIASGIEEICVVCAPGDEAVYRDHFRNYAANVQSAKGLDWAEEQARRLVDLEQRLHFAVQPEPEGYGHAVWCARRSSGPSRSCSCWGTISTSPRSRGVVPAS